MPFRRGGFLPLRWRVRTRESDPKKPEFATSQIKAPRSGGFLSQSFFGRSKKLCRRRHKQKKNKKPQSPEGTVQNKNKPKSHENPSV